MNKKLLVLALSVLNFFQATAVNSDSLFIEEIKKFVFLEFDDTLSGNFFTEWTGEEVYVYLYVSRNDTIANPEEITQAFFYFKFDETAALEKAREYEQQGLHAFCYKTAANSSAMLTRQFVMYSEAAKAFIIFHELMHNYIKQHELKIPYELNEALCDIAGNFGALYYFRKKGEGGISNAEKQMQVNEKVYEYINFYTAAINNKTPGTDSLNAECEMKINAVLQEANAFQKDRFAYPVNNAYLLKNQFYSRYYFLLKEVFLRQDSMKSFLEIIGSMPADVYLAEKYLQGFR